MAKGKTRKPTLKQELAVTKMIENGGNKSQALRDAGYSEGYARNSHKITKTSAWDQLMEKYLPDKLLAKTQKGLISATQLHNVEYADDVDDKTIRKDIASIADSKIVRITPGQRTLSKGRIHKFKTVVYSTPIHDVRQKAMDTAMKVKNKYPAQKHEVGGENGGPFIVQVVSYDPDEQPAEPNTT